MNPIRAIEDSNLFRAYVTGTPDGDLTSWKAWLAFLRILYGLTVRGTMGEIARTCTGRKRFPQSGFDECLLLCGRRSGKSRITALVAAMEAVLSGRHEHVAPGEIPMVAIVSPTRFQSRIVHSYLRAVFDSSPMLAREVEAEQRESFKLKNGVELSIITADPRAVRGFSVIACVVDEIAMFGLAAESRVRSDTELIRAIRPSLASTGGRLLAIGTPYRAAGYAYETYKNCFGNDTATTLVWNAPSTEMNPTLNPSVVERAIAEDPIAAKVEYCVERGLFREDVASFINRAVVESLVIRGRLELPPKDGIGYAAFADVSGGRHDDAALAIAHLDGRTVILDALERYPSPHNPYEVVASMAMTMQRYGLNRCSGDAYSAEWSRTAFAEHGVQYNRATTSEWNEGVAVRRKVAKPKSTLYAELLPRLNSGEIELLDNDTLVSQLCSLERRTRSGGRDSIDHPPSGHDDLANALAGVADACHNKRIKAGGLRSIEPSPAVQAVGRLTGARRTAAERSMNRIEKTLDSANRHELRIARGGADYGGRETERAIIRRMSNGRRA